MHKTVIADPSCFILLDNINLLFILENLYKTVITTPEVVSEFGKSLPAWVEIQTPINTSLVKELSIELDAGESSAIVLATELLNCILIIDESKARKFAKELNIPFTGTLGVLIRAKLEGIIPSLIPVIESIKNTNFRMSDSLIDEALKATGEL